MKRCLLFVLITIISFGRLLIPVTALAAEARPLNLVTSPLPIGLNTVPGKTVTTQLRVKQGGPQTERLKVSIMKFSAFGEEGKPRLLDREPGDTYFDWVRFDKTSFNAPANVWQTVNMTINVPKQGAAFGYYYAVVFSRFGDDQRQTGNTNAISGGTAVLVLLDVLVPNAKRVMTLESLTSERGLYEFLPGKFKIKFNNTGNVHLVPHGNVFLMRGKKQVGSLILNGEQGNILPSTKRTYVAEWQDGFPHYQPQVVDGKVLLDKNRNQVQKLMWSNGGDGQKDIRPHLRMGRYTAHVFAVYNEGDRDVPMEARVSFWVIPWRFLAVVLVVFSLVGFGIYSLVRGAWRGARRVGRRK